MTSIEIMTKLIVLRASYSDIILITSITNKALQRYGESQRLRKEQAEKRTSGKSNSQKVEGKLVASSEIPLESIGKARVIMAREQVYCSNVETEPFLIFLLVEGDIRWISIYSHWRTPRTTDVASQSQAIHHSGQRLVWRGSFLCLYWFNS
jgi:hypothetical protein